MHGLVTSPWLTLGAMVGLPLLVIWLARMSHRPVHCPYCGMGGQHYIGFFSELRPQAIEIGPVNCKRCYARFVFMA